MQTTLRPQPQVLTIWRILLACALFPVAFLLSLVFSPGALLWNLLTGAWVLLFLGMYLFYFPVRLRRLSLTLDEENFVFTGGVFEKRVRSVPRQNIQYVTLASSPLHRLWGLSSLVLVSAGGRVRMSGLKEADARRLVEFLF